MKKVMMSICIIVVFVVIISIFIGYPHIYNTNTSERTIIIKEVETIYVPTEVPIYIYKEPNDIDIVNPSTTKEEEYENPSYDNSHLYDPTVYEDRKYYGELDVELENCIYEACKEYDVPIPYVYALIKESTHFNYQYVDFEHFGLLYVPIEYTKLYSQSWGLNIAEVHDNIYIGVRIIKSYLEQTKNNYTRASILFEYGYTSGQNLLNQPNEYTTEFALKVNKSMAIYSVN